MEDWENFGHDYSKTLIAWKENFDKNWHKIAHKYGERFFRMWTCNAYTYIYLLFYAISG